MPRQHRGDPRPVEHDVVRRISARAPGREGPPDTARRPLTEGEAAVLRIAVQGGGCSGFQYALGFDRGPQEGDNELQLNGVDVVVDPFSAPYLAGTEIDWVEGLQAGFAINNPNVSASCGCGHSFQVEEGETPAEEGAAGCGSGCH